MMPKDTKSTLTQPHDATPSAPPPPPVPVMYPNLSPSAPPSSFPPPTYEATYGPSPSAPPTSSLSVYDSDAEAALMIAAEKGNFDVVNALLANKRVDPNIKNNNDKTALMIAAEKGNFEIAELLLLWEKKRASKFLTAAIFALATAVVLAAAFIFTFIFVPFVAAITTWGAAIGGAIAGSALGAIIGSNLGRFVVSSKQIKAAKQHIKKAKEAKEAEAKEAVSDLGSSAAIESSLGGRPPSSLPSQGTLTHATLSVPPLVIGRQPQSPNPLLIIHKLDDILDVFDNAPLLVGHPHAADRLHGSSWEKSVVGEGRRAKGLYWEKDDASGNYMLRTTFEGNLDYRSAESFFKQNFPELSNYIAVGATSSGSHVSVTCSKDIPQELLDKVLARARSSEVPETGGPDEEERRPPVSR